MYNAHRFITTYTHICTTYTHNTYTHICTTCIPHIYITHIEHTSYIYTHTIYIMLNIYLTHA